MQKIKWLWSVLIACVALAVALISLQIGTQPSYAQSPGDIQVVKVLNQTSPVVKVGEFISFTVFVTNTSSFTLIHATLFDDYREDILGAFSPAPGSPPPSSQNPAAGELTWTDFISSPAGAYFPELGPGDGLAITMLFQVQHPPVGGFTIVNRAQIRDAVFSQTGSVSDTDFFTSTAPITGGSAPMSKQLNPATQTPGLGDLVTYTILLTNDGAAALTETVIADTFDPTQLSFITSTPYLPTILDSINGVITWTTLASPPIQPGQVISIDTIFEVITAGAQVTNNAQLIRARDAFGNGVAAPGGGQAGIVVIIIDDNDNGGGTVPDNTTSGDKDDDHDDDHSPTATPTATPTAPSTATPTATAVVSQTAATAVTLLPETGHREPPRAPWPLLGLILLTGSWYFFRMNEGSS